MASTGEVWKLGHRPALDGVRGIAILLVVACHAVLPWSVGAAAGVTLFFVLSGYLITGILLAEHQRQGRIDLRRFYLRRTRRLLPALLVILAVAPVVMWLVGDPRLSGYVPEALSALFYVRNYYHPDGGGWLGHGWSLAVEEQFYLLWPVVVLAVSRYVRRAGAVALLVAGAAGVAFVWRAVETSHLAPNVYDRFDTNAFGLLAGAALAAGERWRPVAGGRHVAWCGYGGLGGLVGLAAMHAPTDPGTWYVWAVWSGPLALVPAVALVHAARAGWTPMAWRPLCWFGTVSYGWYLWHGFLFGLRFDGQSGGPAWIGVALFGSLAVAWGSWRYVEQPILRAGSVRRLEPVQHQPDEAVQLLRLSR